MITLEEEGGLIRKTKAGDQRSFEALEANSREKIFLHMKGFVKNEHDAEDIYQKGLTKAWRKIKKFRGDCRFSTWLCRICYNLAYDEFRRRRRRPTESLEEMARVGTLNEEKFIEIHKKSERTGSENLELVELKHKLTKTLSKLPDKHKQVLVMFAVEDMSYSDIAKKLNISAGTVMSRMFYARKYAKQLYEQKESHEKSY
jgi:RNA polymerase sigma-70 factor (ECF subfamily)